MHHVNVIFGTRVNWWYPQPSFFLYLRNHLCGYNFWCTFVKWWYLQVFFFSFFQNFDFSCYRGKGQKMAENGKKFCLSHSISQEPYIIWSSFMKNKCKMIISPRYFFHFFKTLIFLVVLTVKGQKMAQNEKNSARHFLYLKNHPSYDLSLWNTCVKGYLHNFLYFFPNFDFQSL